MPPAERSGMTSQTLDSLLGVHSLLAWRRCKMYSIEWRRSPCYSSALPAATATAALATPCYTKVRGRIAAESWRSMPSAAASTLQEELQAEEKQDMLDDLRSPVEAGSTEKPEHLLLMVNGLFGSSANWRVAQRHLEKLGIGSRMLMLASNANLKLQTFEGIDNCGKRLAKELQECIDANPSLKYISVMGHSMGGLIARYTLGILYDPERGLIAGLQPRHFISLATPHLGCGGEGPAQVPFIGWTAEVPLVGGYATKVLQYWADSFASTVLRRTGDQFFLLDVSDGRPPLLVRMTQDGPDGYFFSALKAFASRTCYANSSGDHIVGWANSSIRHPDELPDLGDLRDAKGVVREDPLQSAIQSSNEDGQRQRQGILAASPLEHIADSRARASASSKAEGEKIDARTLERANSLQQAEETVESSVDALEILEKLQTLPWCRVDTSFQGTTFPYFAHNLIQVTREWLNWEGESVVQHLTQHFNSLEDVITQ